VWLLWGGLFACAVLLGWSLLWFVLRLRLRSTGAGIQSPVCRLGGVLVPGEWCLLAVWVAGFEERENPLVGCGWIHGVFVPCVLGGVNWAGWFSLFLSVGGKIHCLVLWDFAGGRVDPLCWGWGSRGSAVENPLVGGGLLGGVLAGQIHLAGKIHCWCGFLWVGFGVLGAGGLWKSTGPWCDIHFWLCVRLIPLGPVCAGPVCCAGWWFLVWVEIPFGDPLLGGVLLVGGLVVGDPLGGWVCGHVVPLVVLGVCALWCLVLCLGLNIQGWG